MKKDDRWATEKSRNAGKEKQKKVLFFIFMLQSKILLPTVRMLCIVSVITAHCTMWSNIWSK